jgi:hypothetical protein
LPLSPQATAAGCWTPHQLLLVLRQRKNGATPSLAIMSVILFNASQIVTTSSTPSANLGIAGEAALLQPMQPMMQHIHGVAIAAVDK